MNNNIEQTLSIIKPDAVEKFGCLKTIRNQKKFYKVHETNHFIMIYVLIYLQV